MVIQTQRKSQTAIAPPKRATKTASALAAAHISATEVKQKRKRTKQGCITCRVRGKKCDEVRNDDGTCNTCNRLRIHCLGFVDRRPEWLRTKENIKVWRKRVTDFLLSQGFVKGYAGCGLRSANVPERRLTLQEMRENLSTGDASEPDSPDSPPAPAFTAPAPPTRLPHPPFRDEVFYGTTWPSHTQLHIHYTQSDSESNSTPPQQLNDLNVDVTYQDQHQYQHQHQHHQQNPTSIASPSPYSPPSYTLYNHPNPTTLPPLLSSLPSQHPGYVAPGLVSGASMFY